MTLILVGAGVAFDLTLEGLEALKKCDEAFIETYTNPTQDGAIERIEGLCKKNLVRLGRDKVESQFLVEKARSNAVCLVVSGDPLTATTHITLVIDAKAKGAEVRVIHNSSIYSVAPARSGLQIYRFGKTASLVNPRPNYKPISSLDIIRQNQENNAHTLVLLDTEPKPMEAKDALEMLSEFSHAVVLSKLGWPEEKITYGKIADLKDKGLGSPPFAIIIPGKPHPVEQEFLDMLLK